MSAMVGTSRAGKPSKDKNAKSAPATASQAPSSNKTDRAAAKNQATVEQMRMAQMIDNGKDAANMATVRQLVEMTGRTEEDVVVALHDAQDDPDRAVLLLLEGEQGEWEEQGKKKKRSNTVKSDKEAPTSVPENEVGDSRPDRSRDRRDHDRHDGPPRRGRDRRNGGPPPRLARGRGRDRNFGGSGGGNRDRDRSNFNGEQEREADWEAEPVIDSRDRRPERGQFGERGRGRGRGGFGRPVGRGGPRRFDRPNESSDGPHIDTWTNETAENAEKENNSWGETWGESTEDWSEDTWTGSLEESKVFTPSQTNSMVESDLTPALSDTTNTIGQRLDVGSLFSKSAEFAKAPDFTKTTEPAGDSFFSQYNQQATESIKNSIGIGSSTRQNLSNIAASQAQPLGALGSMPQRDMSQGVRSSLPSSAAHSMMPPVTSAALQSSNQQQAQRRTQRSKLPPPSKIPQSAVEMPGHMMPQLDVQFGVDFGSDSSQFGFGSSGGGGDSSTVPSFSVSTSSSSSGLTNHLGQTNMVTVESSRQSSVMSSPSAGSKPQQSSSLPPMDGSPSRPTVFPSTVYSTPTKPDSQSIGQSANKVPAEPIPFPSPSDHKASGLVNSQRTAQSPAALSQGSLSTSKPDTSTLPSFSAANGFASNSYSAHAHKSSSHSSSVSSTSQTFPHTAVTSQPAVSSFQSQYTSQNQFPGSQVTHGSQSQFPSAGQTQFPSNQSQYHGAGSTGSSGSGQNQYMPSQAQYQSGQGPFPQAPSVSQSQYQSSGSQYGSYQSGSSSFQNQSSMSSGASSQSTQNSLYPASTQQSGSSYPQGSSSFHVRDSQSSSSMPGSGVSQSGNSFPTQPAPGLKASTTQSPSSYSTQTYSGSQHPQNLQPSPLTNKLGDSLSKISLKDGSLDSRSSSQFDHGSTSTTSANLTSTTTSSSISAVTSTVSATTTPVTTSSTLNSRASTALPVTTKAPPNLPPGVPLLNPPYIMGQAAGTLPPFYGLQQPAVYGYEDMQMLQQRLPTLQTGTGYYDMSTAFPGVPSTIAGRDQAAALGTAPFTGSGTDNKPLNRVEAQSPNASSQQQSTHNAAPQQTLPFNIHYGYYYPGAVLPGATGFQYPAMFQMPPVTNAPAPHVPGTTTANQLPKTYGSHQGFVSKGYEEVGNQELNKPGYAGLQQPTKVAGGSRTGTAAEMNAAPYTKSHTQGFDKQGFPGGTPPPFNLPLASASQAGPLGAPAAPYGAAPFLPMIPPQHSQTILHHPLQQDSTAGSGRGLQQPANQAKSGGGKPYATYWGN